MKAIYDILTGEKNSVTNDYYNDIVSQWTIVKETVEKRIESECRCRKCGKKLTSYKSIERGLGFCCATKINNSKYPQTKIEL